MSLDVLVHANAGKDVGLGHLVRCVVLANELTSRGISVELHCPDDGVGQFVLDQGLDRDQLRLGTSLEDTGRTAADAFIIDSYDATEGTFEAIRRAATVIVVDELGDRSLPVELVINSNVYAEDIEYPSAERVLRGPAFSMLRPAFRDLPEPRQTQPPENLLVTIGGSDLTGSLSDVLGLLAPVTESGTMVHTIVGPYFERPSEPPLDAVFHRKPENIHELMLRADLAVSGGGQTLYELAAVGTPTVAIRLGPDQAQNIEGWATRGFCTTVGEPSSDGFETRVRSVLTDMYSDIERRRQMAATGRDTVDGYGAVRVADVIESVI